jgi:hypothetical protein
VERTCWVVASSTSIWVTRPMLSQSSRSKEMRCVPWSVVMIPSTVVNHGSLQRGAACRRNGYDSSSRPRSLAMETASHVEARTPHPRGSLIMWWSRSRTRPRARSADSRLLLPPRKPIREQVWTLSFSVSMSLTFHRPNTPAAHCPVPCRCAHTRN